MGNYWSTTYYDYWGNSFSAELNNAKEHVNALTSNDSSDAAITVNMVNGGVVRYRADQEERYGSDYRDLGDSYYDGGPWMMPASVTGTSLNWSYDSSIGRVRLYGTLNASTSNDITISF